MGHITEVSSRVRVACGRLVAFFKTGLEKNIVAAPLCTPRTRTLCLLLDGVVWWESCTMLFHVPELI